MAGTKPIAVEEDKDGRRDQGRPLALCDPVKLGDVCSNGQAGGKAAGEVRPGSI